MYDIQRIMDKMNKIELPVDVEHISEHSNTVRIGRDASLEEIQAFLKNINFEIKQLLMITTVAACYGRATIVQWILENTAFDADPETHKPQRILDYIVKNNQIDVLKVCVGNPRMLHILKTSRMIFSTYDLYTIEEDHIPILDYAALDAVESDQIEILSVLYPYISSETCEIYPNSNPASVKHAILKHLIQKHGSNKHKAWSAMIQTILDDTSYDPSYPHDNEPLQQAIKYLNVEIVALLLSHPRVKICEDTVDDELMTEVCFHCDSDASLEILKMFLDDPRFTPSRDANDPIHTLAQYSCNRGLAYIVNCPRIRWDWFGRPSPLAKCVENKNMEGVRILLGQPLYDPCMNSNDAYQAAKEIQSTHPEFMVELKNNERVAKYVQKWKSD